MVLNWLQYSQVENGADGAQPRAVAESPTRAGGLLTQCGDGRIFAGIVQEEDWQKAFFFFFLFKIFFLSFIFFIFLFFFKRNYFDSTIRKSCPLRFALPCSSASGAPRASAALPGLCVPPLCRTQGLLPPSPKVSETKPNHQLIHILSKLLA